METLQAFRPALADLAKLRQHSAGPADFPGATSLGQIPADYFRRRIAAFRVVGGEPVLDLCSPATHALLRRELAEALVACGYAGAFNFGEVLGSDYRVTQRIAAWAHDHAYTGVAYPSTHDHRCTCWAIFDSATVVSEGDPETIQPDDPDLLTTAALFGLHV